MLKRDEIERLSSCLNRAAPDEPIFVLRANDETAPRAVRDWAMHYYESKGGPAKMTAEQLAKYNEALKLASDMQVWQIMHARQQ